MPHEDKNYDGSLALDFRKRWRHVKTRLSAKNKCSGSRVCCAWDQIKTIYSTLGNCWIPLHYCLNLAAFFEERGKTILMQISGGVFSSKAFKDKFVWVWVWVLIDLVACSVSDRIDDKGIFLQPIKFFTWLPCNMKFTEKHVKSCKRPVKEVPGKHRNRSFIRSTN